MSDERVSCIIPVHNGEAFLAEAVRSILEQTHAPHEVIIVDDGSTDGTPRVIRGFRAPVRGVRQDNAGPAVARNRGLEAATGAFIAFLDADDTWHPEKLERQLAAFRADPGLGVCLCHVQNHWVPELAEEAERLRDHPRARPLPGAVTQAMLVSRAAFETVGHFDAALTHGDAAEWLVRAERAGVRRRMLEDVLVRRRIHPGSLSRCAAGDSRAEFLRLVKARLDAQRRPGDGRVA